MSATSPVAIINRALIKVGGSPITSLGDGSIEAIVADANYDMVRDAVTTAYEWTHAIKRFGPMNPTGTNPPGRYSYEYTLPADFLKMVFVSNDPNENFQLKEYAVESRKLLAKIGSGINIIYIGRVTDTTKFMQLFTEAFVFRLAAEFAMPLAESNKLQLDLMDLYEQKVDEAAGVDGTQGINQQTIVTRTTRARWAGGVSGSGFNNVEM